LLANRDFPLPTMYKVTTQLSNYIFLFESS
jgi:hypothetical protein